MIFKSLRSFRRLLVIEKGVVSCISIKGLEFFIMLVKRKINRGDSYKTAIGEDEESIYLFSRGMACEKRLL